jgi:ATP-dependent Clp protease protease subunit
MNTLILEEDAEGEYAVDLYNKLAKDRILFVSDDIDDQVATEIVASLLMKDKEDNSKKITLFINSPGGDIRSIFMIYDVMQSIESQIETICLGEALNETILLLAAGTKGMRMAVPHSIVQLTQLEFNYTDYGSMERAKIHLERTTKDNLKFIKCLAKHCNKTVARLTKDLENQQFLSSKEAQEYGIIDLVTKAVK